MNESKGESENTESKEIGVTREKKRGGQRKTYTRKHILQLLNTGLGLFDGGVLRKKDRERKREKKREREKD
jgi:hypothetical protein